MEVKAHYREGRNKPWEARWWVHRKMRSKFFATEKERDKFLREFNKEIVLSGDEVFKFDKEQMKRWNLASQLLPNVDPIELVEFWLDHHSEEAERTLSQALPIYTNQMKLAGRDPSYLKHTAKAFERFEAVFGDKPIGSIQSTDIAEFIHSLPFEPLTKRHYRTYLAGAFKWFMQQGWIINNPVASVPAPRVMLEEPGILTVKETRSLFRANEKEDPEICALLALGAFAGMRSSAIARMDYKEIDFAARAILTPASKTKKNRRQFIEGLPQNLFEWLSLASKKTFAITPRQFAKRGEIAFQRAGLLVTKAQAKREKITPKAPPKNCLRHSFVSYHVALHRNPGHTALLISHKNQNILYEHYLGVATKEDAERYFGIKPV